MSAFAAWFAPRKRVLGWIALGYASFFVLAGACVAVGPRLAPIAAPLDRLLLAVQLAAGPALVAFAMFSTLGRVLDTVEAENPLLGAESTRFRINQRVLTNTLEQTAIFVPALLALSLRMDPSHTWALPYLAGVWCAGRALFWLGYHSDPAHRAIGMDWTTCTAMTTVGWLVATLL